MKMIKLIVVNPFQDKYNSDIYYLPNDHIEVDECRAEDLMRRDLAHPDPDSVKDESVDDVAEKDITDLLPTQGEQINSIDQHSTESKPSTDELVDDVAEKKNKNKKRKELQDDNTKRTEEQ